MADEVRVREIPRPEIRQQQAVPAVPPPLSLYIHLPWCIRKCPYCDFNSHEVRGALPTDHYLQSLIADLEQSLPQVWGRPVQSIFIGGGTPNLFPPSAIDQLLVAVRARLKVAPMAEVTLEANPAAVREESADWHAYRQAGVTRVSVGVQSFDAGCLQALGRLHSVEQAVEAVAGAVTVFERVNLDLMYGLPGQTVEMAQDDLRQALALGVGHLSLYQLTLEPNTLFAVRPPSLPEEDAIWEMQTVLVQMLEATGLARYEVSAYARPGQRCQHNLNYWEFGDYLGLGAGAHSKLSLADQGIVRQWCLRQPQAYQQAVVAGDGSHRQTRPVEARDLGFEYMLNGLRLVSGVPVTGYFERTGRPAEDLLPGVAKAQERGLLCTDGHYWRATPRGFDFLNTLQEIFLPD
ncbi:MAG: hypothetical protein RLZZ344_846 [Pseudomonadota bacterium]|jgi:oxygen-independent coproporphyrinogen-3 oxidase